MQLIQWVRGRLQSAGSTLIQKEARTVVAVPGSASESSNMQQYNGAAAPVQAKSGADLSFLSGCIHVGAIHPDTGAIKTHHFGDDRPAAEKWIDEWNAAGWNAYFSVNEVREGFHEKPTKAEIVRRRFFHVDVDDTQDPKPLFALAPFVIINSGNGIQGLWLVAGNPPASDVEDVNQRVTHKLHADRSCCNVDRLLRVPGTINYPNAKKRERGRVPVMASLLFVDRSVTWEVDWMRSYFPPVPKRESAATPDDVELGPWEPKPLSDLRPPLPRELLAHCARPLGSGEDRSAFALGCAHRLAERSYPREDIMGVLMSPANESLHAHIADQPNGERAARRMVVAAEASRVRPVAEMMANVDGSYVPKGARPLSAGAPVTAGRTEPAIFSRKSPVETARAISNQMRDADGVLTCRRWRDEFYQYRNGRYEAQDAEAMEAIIRRQLADAVRYVEDKSGKAKLEPFNPRRADVGEVEAALGSETLVDGKRDAPFWIEGALPVPATELFGARNGLVHLPSRTLYPATPRFFNTAVSSVVYEPNAPSPELWFRFLESVHGSSSENIALLQEWFGYCLAPDTRFQKMLLRIGPKRGGKGTEMQVLCELLGEDAVAGFTLATLSKDFALQGWPGKLFAVDGDARVGSSTSNSEIASLLLKISAGDPVPVNRKQLPILNNCRLTTRIALLTNELPRIPDAAGALANRFVILESTVSFLDREDVGLFEAIRTTDMPGVLNWALEGRVRLYRNGRFTTTQSGRDALASLEKLQAPVRAFVEDECELQPGATIEKQVLYQRYGHWCGQQGLRPSAQPTFGRDLHAAFKEIGEERPRIEGGRRVTMYTGIACRPLTAVV